MAAPLPLQSYPYVRNRIAKNHKLQLKIYGIADDLHSLAAQLTARTACLPYVAQFQQDALPALH